MQPTFPRDDCYDNPFTSYDAVRDWLDDCPPDDDFDVDDLRADPDYLRDMLLDR